MTHVTMMMFTLLLRYYLTTKSWHHFSQEKAYYLASLFVDSSSPKSYICIAL